MARKYVTVINASVLFKKIKYKSFKKIANNAALLNLINYLFTKDVLRQLMRFGLAKTGDQNFPDIIASLYILKTQYSALINSFLPFKKQDLKKISIKKYII